MTMEVLLPIAILAAILPGYAIGWGSLSLINAGLAQSKNHSGFVWWVISLFLGPVATFIIVAILRKTEQPVPKYYDEFG
jgi:hypothetical protein